MAETLRAWRGVVGDDKGARGDFSQPAAAEHIGVPVKTYRAWEQGVYAPDGLKLGAVLAKIKNKP